MQIHIPSQFINETIKRSKVISPENINIIMDKEGLKLSCNGDDNVMLYESFFKLDNDVKNDVKNDYVKNDDYNYEKFKNIGLFCDLCNMITTFTNKDDIIIFNIQIASLGELKIGLSPTQDP